MRPQSLTGSSISQSAVTFHRVAAFCFTRFTHFELARVLVRFDQVASCIVNANHLIGCETLRCRLCYWVRLARRTTSDRRAAHRKIVVAVSKCGSQRANDLDRRRTSRRREAFLVRAEELL